MNISFKAKIPISECQIYDREKKQFTNATLWEYDCKDYSDIKHFKMNFRRWTYMEGFISGMRNKYRDFCQGLLNKESEQDRFYSLELPNNYIVGFCETTDNNEKINIHYLETQRDRRYKYAGQSILASLAKKMINSFNDPIMTIDHPANSARNFYINKCGFQPYGEKALHMYKYNMSDFVKTFEERTQSPIIDYRC